MEKEILDYINSRDFPAACTRIFQAIGYNRSYATLRSTLIKMVAQKKVKLVGKKYGKMPPPPEPLGTTVATQDQLLYTAFSVVKLLSRPFKGFSFFIDFFPQFKYLEIKVFEGSKYLSNMQLRYDSTPRDLLTEVHAWAEKQSITETLIPFTGHLEKYNLPDRK